MVLDMSGTVAVALWLCVRDCGCVSVTVCVCVCVCV